MLRSFIQRYQEAAFSLTFPYQLYLLQDTIRQLQLLSFFHPAGQFQMHRQSRTIILINNGAVAIQDDAHLRRTAASPDTLHLGSQSLYLQAQQYRHQEYLNETLHASFPPATNKKQAPRCGQHLVSLETSSPAGAVNFKKHYY